MIQTDVLIIGGGPAGSACGWCLQRAGLDTLILDKASFPRYKLCAGWVTPAIFPALQIKPEDYPHTLTSYHRFEIWLKGVHLRLPTRQYAIRRTEFDAWLLQRSGAESRVHEAKKIEKDGDYFVVDGQYRAQYLVGAGGTHGPVRKALFEGEGRRETSGLILAKEEELYYPTTDQTVRLWFFEDGLPGYAWYFPKADGYLNVGVGATADGLRERGISLNQHWEKLLARLDAMGLVQGHAFRPQGYSYYLQSGALEPRRGNVFLVGDALGIATVDMGEGITPSIRSGILAAESIINNAPYRPSRIPRFSLPSLLRLRQ